MNRPKATREVRITARKGWFGWYAEGRVRDTVHVSGDVPGHPPIPDPVVDCGSVSLAFPRPTKRRAEAAVMRAVVKLWRMDRGL